MSSISHSHIKTSHSSFLRSSPDPAQPPIALLLRGVNLSSTSKFPNIPNPPSIRGDTTRSSRKQRDLERQSRAGVLSHLSEEQAAIWTDAEKGGRPGWFVGHPFAEEQVDVSVLRD